MIARAFESAATFDGLAVVTLSCAVALVGLVAWFAVEWATWVLDRRGEPRPARPSGALRCSCGHPGCDVCRAGGEVPVARSGRRVDLVDGGA